MQKLEERNTYIPMDTSHVRSSMICELNRDQSLSATNLKTPSNNPEETQLQHKGEQDLRVLVNVYVLTRNGKPLMPTSPRDARKLLKENKAKVVKRCPFTIQMFGPCGESVQEITCGIDSGYENAGFNCLTEKKVLIAGEVKLDSRMKNRLDERRMYRKLRRNKLWYRKPRFLNRATSKGWLPPSIQRRFDTHIALIERLKKILPISKVIVETASFDTQKLNRPDITGEEYQQGEMYGFENTRNYIFARENGTCQLCKKSDGKFQLHHITPRSKGGTDKPNNLALLHEGCHKKLHRDKLENTLPKNKQYKASIFMSVIHNKFQEYGYETTYGYITSGKRKELDLEKSHANDAFVIAGGTIQRFSKPYRIIQKRKNNRSIQLNRKGFKPSIRKQHYINQPHDLIIFNNEVCEVIGTHNKGKTIQAKNSFGKIIEAGIKKVKELYHTNGLVWKLN
jgi:hypothetical protein